MKIIIAGGRDYEFTDDDYLWLYRSFVGVHIDEVITGGATGADEYGKRWALDCDLKHTEIKADWDEHGKAAGPIRNSKMLDEVSNGQGIVVLFPGGKGTADLEQQARDRHIPVFKRSDYQ